MRESLPLGKAGLVRWVRLLLSTLGPTQAFGALTSTRAAYFLLVVCIDMAFKRILVATDFSESAERALDLAVEMARKFDAELTLVHSWEVPYAYGDALHVTVDLIMSLQEAAQKHLDAALVELKQRFPNAKSDLRTGSPWEEILTAATDGGAELIVLGTHGRRGLNRALLGSVAEKVVRMAEVPVLTVHGSRDQ